MSKLLRLCVLLLALSVSTVFAAPAKKPAANWYKIEIIVFSHVTAQNLQSEVWPAIDPSVLNTQGSVALQYPAPVNPDSLPNPDLDSAQATTAQAADAANPVADSAANVATASAVPTGPVAFQALKADQFILQKQANAIKQRSAYPVIMHLAWLQQLAPNKKAVAVHFVGGQAYDADGSVEEATTPAMADAGTTWQVNGVLRIDRRHYFQAGLDMLFSEPSDTVTDLASDVNFNNISNGFAYFHLLQQRRLRSKELNYFDFPLYGVLLEVTPYTANSS